MVPDRLDDEMVHRQSQLLRRYRNLLVQIFRQPGGQCHPHPDTILVSPKEAPMPGNAKAWLDNATPEKVEILVRWAELECYSSLTK